MNEHEGKSIEPLKTALAEYDRTAVERQHKWDTVESSDDVDAADQADKDALVKVQDAFFEVTRDRNSRDNCGLADIASIREYANLKQA